MAEILGIPVSALPASGASTPVPTLHKAHLNTSSALAGEPLNADSGNPSPAASDTKPDDGRTEDMISTAPISVFEYFRRKLAQKKAEREGLPVPEMSYATEGYSDVAKDFEGKKIKFDTDEDEEDAPTNTGIGLSSSNSTSVNSPVEVASQTKEERKAAQKAAKEAEKAAKKAAKAELKRQAGLSAGSSKKDKKRKRGDDADQSAREEGEDARPKKSKSKGKERASDDAEDPETIAKKSKKEKREKRGKGEAAVESTSNVETGADVPPAKKAKKPKKDVSTIPCAIEAPVTQSLKDILVLNRRQSDRSGSADEFVLLKLSIVIGFYGICHDDILCCKASNCVRNARCRSRIRTMKAGSRANRRCSALRNPDPFLPFIHFNTCL